MQPFETYLTEAIEAVSAWNDLSDEKIADAVNAQTRLMCGASSDDYWQPDSDAQVQ